MGAMNKTPIAVMINPAFQSPKEKPNSFGFSRKRKMIMTKKKIRRKKKRKVYLLGYLVNKLFGFNTTI
jgi:hypothetical protein